MGLGLRSATAVARVAHLAYEDGERQRELMSAEDAVILDRLRQQLSAEELVLLDAHARAPVASCAYPVSDAAMKTALRQRVFAEVIPGIPNASVHGGPRIACLKTLSSE